MSKLLIVFLFLSACSSGIITQGGEGRFLFDPERDYSVDELKAISSQVVMTSRRNPPDLTYDEYFKSKPHIKKLGIVVFESQIQPTRGGLAGEDKVYLSESGKQLMTEKFLTIWEDSLTAFFSQDDYYPVSKILAFKKLNEFGSSVPDYLYSSRVKFDSTDIFFKKKGSKTTLVTTLSPRGFRDLSLLLVPASELMGGPKWSEHQKHFVNEVSREFGLDAVLVIFSQVSWTSQRIDKHSGEDIGDDLHLNLSASLLSPLSQYRARAEELGVKNPSSVSVCLGSYSVSIKKPLNLEFSKKSQFKQIESQLLNPLFKNYRDLVFMMVDKISQDMKE
jgi:hypothetical protein